MKKHLSVLGLAVRSTFYKTLAVCILTVLAQVGFCVFFLWGHANDDSFYSFDQLIRLRFWGWIAAAAFIAVCTTLCFCSCDRPVSRSGYTLRRLRIGERSTVLWSAVCNIGMLVLLWASLLAAPLLIYFVYCRMVTHTQDPQMLLITFYRSEYLHSLLPLREVSLWIRNISLVIALAVSCAVFPYHQRRGGYRLEPPVLALCILFSFVQEVGSLDSNLVLILIALTAIGFSLSSLRGGMQDEASS